MTMCAAELPRIIIGAASGRSAQFMFPASPSKTARPVDCLAAAPLMLHVLSARCCSLRPISGMTHCDNPAGC
jgi:hypothetical protein